jgi:large subunit ribosomal protein L9
MELILRESIEGLGQRGDVVNVADGYARNYLIPRDLALKPTRANIQRVEKEKQQEVRRQEAELENLKQLAEKLTTVSCTVPVKVGEEGQMYGSVSPQDISRALKDEDFDIDPKCIALEEPIKELGVYTFNITLAPEIEATSKVWVVEG